ncbi:MAG: hypothetical protein ACPG31_08095 [Planctomycetota bacterium]
MPKPRISLFPALLLLFGACSSTESENDEARVEDFRFRAGQYFQQGRYVQAFQQSQLGLKLDEDDGGLNLLAGRSLVMQRDLAQVARAYTFLEIAQEELESYKADYSMAEFHFRYGSMLYGFAQEEKAGLMAYPEPDEKLQAAKLKASEERAVKAQTHFVDSEELLDDVLAEVPEDLNSLEMRGQVRALQGKDEQALADLSSAIDLLEQSRQYKNRVLTDPQLTLAQEERFYRDLDGDIRREVAIRFVMATIFKRDHDLRQEEVQYSTILGLDPNAEIAYHSRALCRYELGRLAEASADMREFVGRTDLGYDTPQVREAMRIIDEHTAIQGG